MECKNYQWLVKAPVYVNLKKHYCPSCKKVLNVVKISKIVVAGSDEARRMNLNFSMAGGFFQSGKVKVIWKEFECPQCNQRITVEKMKELEGYPR